MHVSGPLVQQKTLEFFGNPGHDVLEACAGWTGFRHIMELFQKLSVVEKKITVPIEKISNLNAVEIFFLILFYF